MKEKGVGGWAIKEGGCPSSPPQSKNKNFVEAVLGMIMDAGWWVMRLMIMITMVLELMISFNEGKRIGWVAGL